MDAGNTAGWIGSKKVVASLIAVVFVKAVAIAVLLTAGPAPVIGPQAQQSTADEPVDEQLETDNSTQKDDTVPSDQDDGSSEDDRQRCGLCLPDVGPGLL